jgi:hypothetical protein
MKKLLLLIILTATTSAFACDICGCANGGAFFGIMPQSHQQFLGMRYRLRTFDSHLNSERFRSVERFQTAEFWGRFYPVKRVQLLAFVPFSVNEQTVLLNNETKRIQGLGDISITAQYNVLNTFFDSTAHIFDHTLNLGIGTKLATGKYQYDENVDDAVENPNFQLGTGSTDLLLSTISTTRYKKMGLNTEVNYRVTSKNSQGYRFANRFSAATTFFRTVSIKSISLLPNVGISFEHAKQDVRNGTRNEFTGGSLVNIVTGTELFAKYFTAGVSVQLPVFQNVAGGDLAGRPSLSLHLTKVL